MSLIIPGGPGDPRRQASRNPFREGDGAHGLSAGQIEAMNERFERSLPKLVTSDPDYQRSKLLEDDFRRAGVSSSPMRRTVQGTVIGGTNFGAGTLISAQTPYQPEFSSPDRQCFVEGTMVLVADGTKRPIEDLQVGDRVLDRNGQAQTVEAVWCEGVPEVLIELRVWGGRRFRCTTNHQWPVWKWLRECLCGCGGAVRPGACYINHHHPKKGGPILRSVWGTERNYDKLPENYEPVQRLAASDIRPGDLLLLPRKFDHVQVCGVTEEQARLLGYYVAEGSPENGGLQTKFALNADERSTLAADIMAICSRLGVGSYIYDEKTCAGISVLTKGDLRFGAGDASDANRSRDGGYYNRGPGRSMALHAWLEGLAGHGSQTKRLSEEVMCWPLRLKAELVRGYFRGDGYQGWREVNKKKGISFTVTSNSTSAAISSQLSLIMAQLGFPCRVYPKAAFTDGTGTRHADSASMELNGESARRFADLVWQERSMAHERRARIETSTRVMQDDSFTYVKVNTVSIVPNLSELRVFNLSVSGDHSYLVENIATFNSYPVHRVLANRYWRLFHKLDPVIGNCLDLYSDMPWSDFQLTGEGVDGDIKDHFETMSEKVDLLSLLPYIVREFLTVGEVILHCLYDADLRMWDYCTFHNPDNIEVIDAPFIRMDPILELIPDQRLRAILSSGDPLVQKIKAQLPPELLGRLLARQNLPLDSLNCTFLPRKLHPYDVRGTSIISRLWRVLLLEDAVFSTSIATARRHSSPLKIAKLGNPQTGWIPGAEHEQRLLELLAQAELDPQAWLIYHFGVSFEAFGTTERAIWAPREWEGLERIKLVGLGVSKSFMHGEVSYASSVTGLQVFLQRLLTMRTFFTQKWIKKKFFRPISEINDFIKPTKAELSHRVRVRRTAKELDEDSRYIVPDISWDKPLDPNVDRDLIAAADQLTRIGVKFSKKTLMSFINRKYEDELKSSLEEEVLEAKERQKYEKQLGPAGQGTTGTQPGQDAQGNGQGQGQQGFQPPPKPAVQPPPKPGSLPAPSQGPGTAQGQGQEAAGEAQQPAIMRRPMPPPERFQEDSEPVPERTGNWEEDEVRAVLELFRTGRSDEAFWTEAATPVFRKAIEADDRAGAWDDLMLFLEAHGYPDADVGQLRRILIREGVLQAAGEDAVADLYERLPDDTGTDQDADAAFLRAFRKQPGNGAGRFSASLLVGEGFKAAPGGGGNGSPFRRRR